MYCNYCNKIKQGDHDGSKEHAFMLRLYSLYKNKCDPEMKMCLPCGAINMTDEKYERHTHTMNAHGKVPCGYHTKELFRAQQQAKLYCPTCDAQCRSQAEWDNHIATKKHAKDRVDYHCTHCDYRTKLTHLIKQHERTQKHSKIVDASQAE